jgi:hypothetical protein
MFIPDTNVSHLGSRIRIFSIPDPDPLFFTHPGSRVRKIPDPESGSATLIHRNFEPILVFNIVYTMHVKHKVR